MIERYASRAEASQVAANALLRRLQHDLNTQNRASLVLSGGSTPQACLKLLSQANIEWPRVDVTLTDERQVPVTDPASNEGMLRRQLLVDVAASARFVPLEATALRQMPQPSSAVLCGMGSDGHIASLFPDLAELPALLDPGNTAPCAPVITAASPYHRVSLTLAWLCRSRSIVLLAFGADKLAVLEDPRETPVGHLLRQQHTALRILWAP